MTLYHLSHIDLDGYGCQFVTDLFYDKKEFYNSNYGNEINARLANMVIDMEENGDKEVHWLVTDLNLTTAQCQFMETKREELLAKGFNVTLELLDHHSTGKEQAALFPWYYLDNDRCATKIAWDTMRHRFEDVVIPASVEQMVCHINAIDLWHEKDEAFEFGKSAMRLIMESKDINKMLFPRHNVAYKVALLHDAVQFLGDPYDISSRHIALDDAIHFMRKRYLQEDGKNDTLDNLASRYVVKLLSDKKEDFAIDYRVYKGILTHAVGNISVIGNDFLAANEEFAFILDVSIRGTVSLRSSNRVDVAAMAKHLFDGGGHVNASGGKLPAYKEFFEYRDLKAYIQTHIASKTEG